MSDDIDIDLDEQSATSPPPLRRTWRQALIDGRRLIASTARALRWDALALAGVASCLYGLMLIWAPLPFVAAGALAVYLAKWGARLWDT